MPTELDSRFVDALSEFLYWTKRIGTKYKVLAVKRRKENFRDKKIYIWAAKRIGTKNIGGKMYRDKRIGDETYRDKMY
jgi:hypothetical protein